ncbi:Cytosine/adenosine deaminases [Leucobacter sp. 7(1)]|uniref:nucleoside deaminase n=1 Tax=Leucobacter sp. 7(1) TaxID=1255613 RepID=UPI00097EC4CA|nr:nucleoside deaminase [Leucobacter sp. 7(1)]SJN09587.1 Cytosine/adenosine deaminases [Leucobacter sp. 7(1)]
MSPSAQAQPNSDASKLTPTDLPHLRRCIELAEAALAAGDEPFGSVLVDAREKVRFEDHNHVASGDATRHPEFEIARWAAAHLSPAERAAATVYTSGEHCPMCAAAHGWVGLGRIVYVASAAQLAAWMTEWGAIPAPVAALPIQAVAPEVPVAGPVHELTAEIRALHARHRGITI